MAAVIIVLLLVLALLYFTGVFRPTVTVTGVNWAIEYNGITSGYFGPSPQSVCSTCPITTVAGGQFTHTITLTSTALLLPHTIDNLTVATPFTLVSVSPAVPISVTPSGSATLTVTVKAPPGGGSFVMSGTLSTT